MIYLKKKVGIINENDIMLNAIGYFNVNKCSDGYAS